MTTNPIVEMTEEVKRLNAERQAGAAPKQPPIPSEEPQPAPAPTPEEVGPPRFIGVSFEAHFVGTSLGNFPLEPSEEAAIARICSRVLERELKKTYMAVTQHHKLAKSNKLRVVKRVRGGGA